MIKTLIDRWLVAPLSLARGGGAAGKRVEIPKEEHAIDPALVDERAAKVVQTLKDAGYQAYIVGGAVRDLLLGHRPKDFDVATDATPEQVKALFRRAFIIGRRFRIVHVVYGRGRDHEVIEVSTFRAAPDAAAAEQVTGNEKTSKAELAGKSHVVGADGRVLRDNVWGPQIDDAARRDFTVNALYYDPLAEVVVDYHHGLRDARKRVLRMIGDPASRYREDPVRIVRVVRFAAKLGFTIEPKTLEPIGEMSKLLENVPASRLFDEMIKLLQTGHALRSVEELKKHRLIGPGRGVFPILDVVLGAPPAEPGARESLVQLALADTDRRVGEGKSVVPSFLLACMLWRDVQEGWQRQKARGEAPFPALEQAIDSVFDARIGDISGRGKLATDMREIWMMQPRLERRAGNGPLALIEQPRFRAGFDFLRLRADAGEVSAELADWWEDFSLGTDEERRALLDLAREQERGQRRVPAAAAATRGSAPGAGAGVDADAGTAAEVGGGDSSGATAPARKRRRRRKPASAAGGGEQAAGGGAATTAAEGE